MPVQLQPPAGRWPVAARWYLAAISMLALLLVAMHFALQVSAQRQARSVVDAWAAHAGVSMESVRLRMLRGALTIRGLHWQKGGTSVAFPSLLLRGNFTGSPDKVLLTEVQFQDADIRLGPGTAEAPAWLQPLLAGVRRIDGEGRLLIPAGGGRRLQHDLQLSHMQYSLRGTGDNRHWRIEASVLGGQLQLRGDDAGWRWQADDINAARLAPVLGLDAVSGHLSGVGQWQGERRQHGELGLRESGHEEQARLAWHGQRRQGVWQLDVHSRDWPLTMAATYAPQPGNRRLLAGRLDGALHLRVDGRDWQLRMPDATIRDFTVTTPGSAPRRTGFYVRQMLLHDAVLDWGQRRLNVASMDLQDISLAMGGGGEAPLSGWRLVCHDIRINKLKPGFEAGDDMFWLPNLSGRATLSEKGSLTLALSTADGLEGNGERWRLKGGGTLAPDEPWQARLQVEAGEIPFVRLRPLLSGRLSRGREMEGVFDWQGEWAVGASSGERAWYLSAEVTGRDVAMQIDGMHWSAKWLEASVARAAPASPPHLNRIAISDWQCQLPLRPLQASGTYEDSEPTTQPFWLGDWRVDRLTLRHGSVSVGQAGARWLDKTDVTLAPLVPGKVVSVSMAGRLGGGRLQADGHWVPWSDAPHFGGRAKLTHALPFELRDWLRISGLPRLIRGRISADLQVSDEPPSYSGHMNIELVHAALEGGAFADDPLPGRIGYRAVDLFERLGGSGRIGLEVPFSGVWYEKPLGWDVLAEALLHRLKQQAEVAISPADRQRATPLILSHVRLHQEQGLRHNERVRIRKVISYLHRHRQAWVELLPQLGGLPLNDALVARVRRTQRYVADFMVARGIDPGRIMPVWPGEVHRSGEAAGIRIQSMM